MADWHGGRPGAWPRAAAAPYGPAVAGALLAVAALPESIAKGVHAGLSPWGVAVVGLLSLCTTLPLALLRAQPTGAATVVFVACLLSLGATNSLTVAGLGAQLIAAYWLGRHGSQLLAVLLATPYVVLAFTVPADVEARVFGVLLASLAPAAALAGIAQRARGEARENRAARQVIAGTLVEHTARGERARIARELHDVVAHHISMIAVQAETARLTTQGMPPAGAQRLLAIGDTARSALTEMRRLLGVLREDAQADPATRQPQPGLRQLNELIDEAREASGTGTRLILRGRPSALDPGVELAAFRIIQEALTNVRRHAPGAAVDVELHYAGDALELRIRDNGPGPPPAGVTTGTGLAAGNGLAGGTGLAGGHGLAGMRERAAAVGGELRTGAAAGGGFLVEARLPTAAGALL